MDACVYLRTSPPKALLVDLSSIASFVRETLRDCRSEAPFHVGSGHTTDLFSGNVGPQVVITRIAVRDHHLAPSLVEQRSRRVKEESCDDHHQPTAGNVNLPRTTTGKTKSRRISQGRCWRPNLGRLRASVAEMDGSESGDEEKDPTKGVNAMEERPSREGALQHGVKYRSRCKVCSACPHGKQRSYCKECGGSAFASTVVGALVQGSRRPCVHGRVRSTCKECGGGSICVHGRMHPSVQGVRNAPLNL